MRAPWLVLILTKILSLVLGDAVCHHNDTGLSAAGQRSREILSRRRRLAFPKGSTFVMTLSNLASIPVTLPNNWFLALEFDVIWPIPNEDFGRKKLFRRRPAMIKRRHKRELYANFEAALNSRNLPGRVCVLRTICEAKVLLNPPGMSFIEDAVRLILSNFDDEREIDCYDVAHRTNTACDVAYPCPFSILQLFLYNLYSSALS